MCMYVDIQSVGCMYVVYREQSVGSLHNTLVRWKLRQFQQNANPFHS